MDTQITNKYRRRSVIYRKTGPSTNGTGGGSSAAASGTGGRGGNGKNANGIHHHHPNANNNSCIAPPSNGNNNNSMINAASVNSSNSISNHPHHPPPPPHLTAPGHGGHGGHGLMANLDVNNSLGHTSNYNGYNDCSIIGRNNSLGGCSSDEGNSCDFNLPPPPPPHPSQHQTAHTGHPQSTQPQVNTFTPMMSHHSNGSNDNLHPTHVHGQMHHQGQQSMHPHHLPPVHSMHQSMNIYANSMKIEPLDGKKFRLNCYFTFKLIFLL